MGGWMEGEANMWFDGEIINEWREGGREQEANFDGRRMNEWMSWREKRGEKMDWLRLD